MDLELAKLQAMYSKHNAAVAAAEAGGPEVILPVYREKVREKKASLAGAWKPAGKATAVEKERKTRAPLLTAGNAAADKRWVPGSPYRASPARLRNSSIMGDASPAAGCRTSQDGLSRSGSMARSGSMRGVQHDADLQPLDMAGLMGPASMPTTTTSDAAQGSDVFHGSPERSSRPSANAAAASALKMVLALGSGEGLSEEEVVARNRQKMEAKLALIESRLSGAPVPRPPPGLPSHMSGSNSPLLARRTSVTGAAAVGSPAGLSKRASMTGAAK